MPDELSELLSRVRVALPMVSWPDPEQIRTQGSRRDHRRLGFMALGIVVVIVLGVGTAYQAFGPQRGVAPGLTSTTTPVPTTPASTSVVPTAPPAAKPVSVPPSAMLQLADLPPQWRLTDELVGGPSGPDGVPQGWPGEGPWVLYDPGCAQWTSLGIKGYLGRQAIRWHDYEGAGGAGLFEIVERYTDAAAAAAVMAEVRRVVEACGVYQLPVDDLASGSLGEQSWIFTASTKDGPGGTETAYFTVIREGDLVAYINGDPAGRYGALAAQRLCSATVAC